MSDRYVSAGLLFQFQNAAIDLAKQLGAAEERLAYQASRPVFITSPGQIVRCDEKMRPLDIESKANLEQSELWRMQQVAISTMTLCNTRRSFTTNRLPDDNPYRTMALADVEHTVLREIVLLEKLNIAEAALKKLSCLGGTTSEGNSIAQAAIHDIGRIE